jgi:hypothetical protein
MASLSRFILCLGERRLPLYKLSWEANCFKWTMEAHKALDGFKNLLTRAPNLVPLEDRAARALHTGDRPGG